MFTIFKHWKEGKNTTTSMFQAGRAGSFKIFIVNLPSFGKTQYFQLRWSQKSYLSLIFSIPAYKVWSNFNIGGEE